MGDMANIKIGTESPEALMYNTRALPAYNNLVTFASIVPKDNSTSQDFSKVNHSEWQINDGWEIEIITPNRIAIKKFKIDTWGLRLVTSDMDNVINNHRIKINVTGLTYVHENVICHTAGSDTPDGFTEAYCGTGGYNSYWYPGQFTSGKFAKGICIQQGIGYITSSDEIDDSLQMGKHPWDINNYRFDDGVHTQNWSDGSYKAITLGLYGGVQNASKWHDESTGAYRQYDISDTPIYVDLGTVEDTNIPTDVSTVECWDAYIGSTQVWHKDKTLVNYLEKYNLAFPVSWNLYKGRFSSSDYVTWDSPEKFRITSIPEGGITIKVSSTTSNNYVVLNWRQFNIRLDSELPEGVSIKVLREFSNAYDDYDEPSHSWSNPTQNIEVTLKTGDNIIAAVNKEIHKKDSDPSMTYNECTIVVTSSAGSISSDICLEIIPTFSDSESLTLTEGRWGINNMYIHPIVDLESHIDRLNFNVSPYNANFWDPIKEYYKTHVFNNVSGSKFNNAYNIGELELTLPNENFQAYDNAFRSSRITRLTLKGQPNTQITSLHSIFEGCGALEDLVIEIDPEHTPDCIAGANDCSNMFNSCGLKTYPAKFINWWQNRTNIEKYSVPASNMTSAFWNSAITDIPAYPTESIEDDRNTIYAGEASGLFSGCRALKTVGPVLNLELIKPENAENIFRGCDSLTSIKIKNLNHGDWHLDGTEYTSGKIHGDLSGLDSDSIRYLLTNLYNFKTKPIVDDTLSVNSSFTLWESNYFEGGVWQSAYDYKFASATEIVCLKRYEDADSAPYIVSTNAALDNFDIRITGIEGTDTTVQFITENGAALPKTFESDTFYEIDAPNTEIKGFKLIGPSTDTAEVHIYITMGYDLRVPKEYFANLYCPESWRSIITSEDFVDVLDSAKSKGWFIYIGGLAI